MFPISELSLDKEKLELLKREELEIREKLENLHQETYLEYMNLALSFYFYLFEIWLLWTIGLFLEFTFIQTVELSKEAPHSIFPIQTGYLLTYSLHSLT